MFDALALVWASKGRAVRSPDFHGDVRQDGEVDVVPTDGELRDDCQPESLKRVLKLGLVTPAQCERLLHRHRPRDARLVDLLEGHLAATRSHVGAGGHSLPFISTLPEVSQAPSLDKIAQLESGSYQSLPQKSPVDADALADHVQAFPFHVATVEVIEVRGEEFSGHVYNFETESHYYLAAGIFAHNCYDCARKKTLVARFPLKGDRVKSLNPGNASDEKWIVKTVSGIKDEATLRILAQGIFEQVTRNELGCRIVTKNLGSYGGGNLDPDALDSLAGDAIDVRVMRDGDTGNSVQLAALATATRGADFMRELGFSDRFARAYQKAANHIGLPSTFRVKTMGGQFDGQSTGITLDFELMNYIEVRSDKLLPSGEEITAAQANDGAAVTVRVDDSGGQQ